MNIWICLWVVDRTDLEEALSFLLEFRLRTGLCIEPLSLNDPC